MFDNEPSIFTRDKASLTVVKFHPELIPWVGAGKEGIGTDFFAMNMKIRGLFWGSP